MNVKLRKDIYKILVDDFSKKIGFDIETGLLQNEKMRFSGMPFIGNHYGEYLPKILIVGSDIGSDEMKPTFHTFDTKRSRCIHRTNKYNAHLAGTYMTALYLLRDCNEFKNMWQDSMRNITAHWALKKLSAPQVAEIAESISFTNLHKFVTVDREKKSGDQDRKWTKEDKKEEFAIFIEEVKCFVPDIVILQEINPISDKDVEQIKEAVEGVAVYRLKHPSTRKRGGRIVNELIIKPLREQGY
jgi:hypothetical protein